jgi:hypothetical protein
MVRNNNTWEKSKEISKTKILNSCMFSAELHWYGEALS